MDLSTAMRVQCHSRREMVLGKVTLQSYFSREVGASVQFALCCGEYSRYLFLILHSKLREAGLCEGIPCTVLQFLATDARLGDFVQQWRVCSCPIQMTESRDVIRTTRDVARTTRAPLRISKRQFSVYNTLMFFKDWVCSKNSSKSVYGENFIKTNMVSSVDYLLFFKLTKSFQHQLQCFYYLQNFLPWIY